MRKRGTKRPPCVLMTSTAAQSRNCAALKALLAAGADVVVVSDADLEAAVRIVEQIRGSHAGDCTRPRQRGPGANGRGKVTP